MLENNWDDLSAYCTMSVALICYKLFFPTFVEIEGSVLLDGITPDLHQKFLAAVTKSHLKISEIEESFNFLEVGYAFKQEVVATSVLETSMVSALHRAWTRHLADFYPEREFRVSILSPDESGSVHSITFSELRY